MKLARVAGTVVATIANPSLAGKKLLLCDLLDPNLQATGAYVIALDTVGAGPGEPVLILDEGGSARQILEDPDAPVRAVVVGIVDGVTLSP